MGIGGGLGSSGRPGRVAKAKQFLLRNFRSRVTSGLIGDEIFVHDYVLEGSRRRFVAHDDDVLHARKPVSDLFQKGNKVGVDEDSAIVGVADDVGKVLGGESEVERVQDSARAGDREVTLKVPVCIPSQRGDALIEADSQAVQRVHQLLRASPELLNSDPFGDGWIAKVELADASEVDALMDADAYTAETA